jgi:[NiFe] hydrogenase diaphorase moiety small subunit
VDGKAVFGLEGRGIHMQIGVDSATGLGGTNLRAEDKSAVVCPVGCIVHKHTAFELPYGERLYDESAIGSDIEARRTKE